MKRAFLAALVLVSAASMAQDQPAPAAPAAEGQQFSTNLVQTEQAPNYSDLYCAGFLTNESIGKTNLISGGLQSPDASVFARGDTIFVGGGGLQEGSQYSVVRELHDPNYYEPFDGARKAVAAVGQPYAELGRIRVVSLRGGTAVAQVEFSCQNMAVGDIVVPFKEHVPVSYRKSAPIQRFPADSGRLTARIIMAREFDAEVGRGQKVYIDAGADKGIKVGDYFRAVRGYDPLKINPIDTVSYHAPVGEDTQKTPGEVTKQSAATLPVRTLGDMVILTVTPTSSTAMVTDALEDIEVGDYVQLEGPQQ